MWIYKYFLIIFDFLFFWFLYFKKKLLSLNFTNYTKSIRQLYFDALLHQDAFIEFSYFFI